MLRLLPFLAVAVLGATVHGETGTSETKEVAELDWWQKDVIYQIYPRSFKDSNGDGIGDLNGIREKLEYLKFLGVKGIWLSPIYMSPMADFGYDISDYRRIDPTYGTFEDFTKLKDAIHALGLKFILDFVPNHTSDEHEWFQKSESNIEPYSDYYIWKDGHYINGTHIPPNNWLSFFEGSAWTWSEKRQKYYLHQYHKKQPDLNFQNPAVLQEMKDVMKFWLDAGVDGFRLDSANTLVEDDAFMDEPRSYLEGVLPSNIMYLKHIYTWDQPKTYEVVQEFRKLLEEYTNKQAVLNACPDGGSCPDAEKKKPVTKTMFSEAYTTIVDTMRYYGNTTHPGAHFPFNFFFITELDRQSLAPDFQRVINLWYSNMPSGKWANWVVGNHDRSRIASRFGSEMVDSIHMIKFILPGTAITYAGDEIAMEDTFIRWDETIDPFGLNTGRRLYQQFSRDGERAPFLWDDSLSAGFSTNTKTWLPINPNFWRMNLKSQMNQTKSPIKIYKKVLELKTKPAVQFGSLNVKTEGRNILVIERSLKSDVYAAIVNVGSYFEVVNATKLLSEPWAEYIVYVSSLNSRYKEKMEVSTDELYLSPKEGIILTNTKKNAE